MKRKWTETSIKQAFDGFIEQHGRLPTKQEMYEKYNGKFPRPPSVKLAVGITLGEYLKRNYTPYFKKKRIRVYDIMPDEYWIKNFKEQYIEFGYPTEKRYNQLRKPQTPNTQTIAKIIGVKTWREVIEYCDLKKKVELKGELVFEETLENLTILKDKLHNLMRSLKTHNF